MLCCKSWLWSSNNTLSNIKLLWKYSKLLCRFLQELPRFQELIFEDFSRFILVENIFEEVVLHTVMKDIMMGKTSFTEWDPYRSRRFKHLKLRFSWKWGQMFLLYCDVHPSMDGGRSEQELVVDLENDWKSQAYWKSHHLVMIKGTICKIIFIYILIF